MSTGRPRLVLQAAPFLHTALTTPRLMIEVAVATLPVLAAGVWVFGVSALLVVLAATLGAVATEWAFGRPRGRSLLDGSAVLTGVLLGLTLPPALPLWIAFVGGVAGVGLGKTVWGGLGHNLFNPALVGRAFLQAAFPTALTTWVPPAANAWAVPASTFAMPLMHGELDALSAPTPLALLKFQQQPTGLDALLFGDVGGSIGETSALILILCGVVLAWRRAFDWRIPVAILVATAALSGALFLIDSGRYPSPAFTWLSGGLLLGAVFMATDPVSSPTTALGAWLFGIGIGVLVVLIRVWGGLAEGVMYAILLMNAATPLIERVAQPRAFGRGQAA